jgi:AcrR family transcriptional regulator
MPREMKKSKPVASESATSRPHYHHGNLKEALVGATLAMIEEIGPEAVSLREVAKRAGVSSGAPFRHFADRTALMTAVAEEAMKRLRNEVEHALEQNASADPLTRFRAIGSAYLRWATQNPAHFLVISNRRLIHFDSSEVMRGNNEAIQETMVALLEEARRDGLLRTDDITELPLVARALAYGLARMYVDGHLPQWGVAPASAMAMMEAAIDRFIEGIAMPT